MPAHPRPPSPRQRRCSPPLSHSRPTRARDAMAAADPGGDDHRRECAIRRASPDPCDEGEWWGDLPLLAALPALGTPPPLGTPPTTSRPPFLLARALSVCGRGGGRRLGAGHGGGPDAPTVPLASWLGRQADPAGTGRFRWAGGGLPGAASPTRGGGRWGGGCQFRRRRCPPAGPMRRLRRRTEGVRRRGRTFRSLSSSTDSASGAGALRESSESEKNENRPACVVVSNVRDCCGGKVIL